MADEDEFDVDLNRDDVKKVERPKRVIDILQHDTNRALTEEIVEHAQTILDSMPAEYSYKDAAAKLKLRLDSAFGGTWHVIVGKHFGANVTNDDDTLINMKMDGVYFLVMRSGPPDRPLEGAENESSTRE